MKKYCALFCLYVSSSTAYNMKVLTFWTGRYRCILVRWSVFHKFAPVGPPKASSWTLRFCI
uniref:Uncharacterized protein n=1 Tax=Anguilla anguilla TaxID=7936 RepID=A0A0E9XKW9_ANGAN